MLSKSRYTATRVAPVSVMASVCGLAPQSVHDLPRRAADDVGGPGGLLPEGGDGPRRRQAAPPRGPALRWRCGAEDAGGPGPAELGVDLGVEEHALGVLIVEHRAPRVAAVDAGHELAGLGAHR